VKVSSVSPPPPPAPAPLWPAPVARRRRTILGIERRFWLLAWAPVVPLLVFAFSIPRFAEPLFDPRLSIVGLPAAALVLPLVVVNLVAARINATVGAVTVVLTSVLGFLWAMLGPAVVLIVINVSGSTV
jgi:hypothetical protein